MILVNGLKKVKSWFVEPTAVGFKRGTRFLDNDKPQEQTFRNLLESTAFKAEVDDQAKDDDSSGSLAEKAGLVVSATDAQAVEGTDVSGRTLATKPKHLPKTTDVESTFSFPSSPTTTASLTTKLVQVVNTPNSRNNYLVKLGDAFKTALEGWFQTIYFYMYNTDLYIASSQAAISENSADIVDLQNQINSIVVPGADTVIADVTDYKLVRNINGNDFTIRLIIKQSCILTNLVLLPPGLAVAMTIDDARYICYGPDQFGGSNQYKYAISVNFNKLKSDAPYVLGGTAYNLNLRLYDNTGDFNNVDGFNYSEVGGTGNYQIPFILTSGFQISSGTFAQSVLNSKIEFVFKGSFVGKI